MLQLIDSSDGKCVICCIFHVGFIYEAPQQYQITHFIEHLMFRALSEEELSIFEIHNGTTSHDLTYFYIMTDAKNASKALTIFAKILQCPVLSEIKRTLEKNVLLEEDAWRQHAEAYLKHKQLLKSLFGDTVYSRSTPSLMDSLKHITQSHVREHYNTYFKNAFILAVVPRNKKRSLKNVVLKSQLRELALSSFDIPMPVFLRQQLIVPKKVNAESVVMVSSDKGPTTTIEFVFPGYAFANTNTKLYEFVAWIVSHHLPYKRLREENGFTYAVTSNYEAYLYLGYLSVRFRTLEKNISNVVKIALESLKALTKAPLDKRLLHRFKKNYITSIWLNQNSLKNAIRLCEEFAYTGRSTSYISFVKEVSNWTPQDVHEACKNLINILNCRIHIWTPLNRKNLKKTLVKYVQEAGIVKKMSI